MKPQQQTPPTSTEYVEPKGFKGSPNEWHFEHSLGMETFTLYSKVSDGSYKSIIKHHYQTRPFTEYDTNKDESEANFKIISESKNIAKALQDMIDVCAANNPLQIHRRYDVVENAKKVLKQAGLTE